MLSTEKAEVSKYRELKGLTRVIFILFSAAAFALSIVYIFHIVIAGRIMVDTAYFALLLALYLPLVFILVPATKSAPRDRLVWYDILLALLSFAGCFFAFFFAWDIIMEGWAAQPPMLAVIAGTIVWALVLEGCRRAVGLPFFIVVALFSIYPLFCQFMPGFLVGKGYSLTRTVGFHFLGPDGILGLPMRIIGRLIIGFMIFAVALQSTGGGRFFLNLALALFGHIRGGAAKVSIVASALFATLSGSAAANVVTTGVATIPAMKRTGYPPHYAAAVEACASTGGVLTPPVMGAAAFMICEFLEVPYADVVLAAAIPALLFYVGLFTQADFFAARTGLKGIPQPELPSLSKTLKEGWFFILVLFVIMFFLLYMRMEGRAPYYSVAFLFLCAMIRKETRISFRGFVDFIEGTGKMMGELAPAFAALGLVIGSVSLTGLAHGLAGELTMLAGENLALLLIMAAVASFILGMGMTVTACYVFLAMLIIPALVNSGIYPMAAHLFVLYWGMVSYITPPICIAAIIAAGIAGSGAMKTGFQALRLGIIMLIIPFFFVINPALIAHGSATDIIYSTVTAVIGIIFMCAGLERYMPRIGKLNWGTSIPFIISGFLILMPGWQTDLGGVILAAVMILSLRGGHLRKKGPGLA